jgi:mRNA interferase MazF
MTSQGRDYPTRIGCNFQDKTGQIVLDQIRTVDKQRLVKQLGKLNQNTQNQVLKVLQDMFSL